MNSPTGRHFLQIPGPTNVPDRVLRAIDRPTIDHRSADFASLGRQVLEGMQRVFRTQGKVFIFPGSGSGGWEAALVNTLSPGDKVLIFETGEFGRMWAEVAKRLRVKEYPAKKALSHARNYTCDELDAALVRLAELDAALKGASRVAPELELERALVDVTAVREPAAAGA